MGNLAAQGQLDQVLKLCRICGEIKSPYHFNGDKRLEALDGTCKSCAAEWITKRRRKWREAVPVDPDYEGSTKHCHTCDAQLPLTETYWLKCRFSADGFFGECKNCVQQKLPRKFKRHNDEDFYSNYMSTDIMRPE